MAYQIKRQKRITETMELTDSDGTVAHTIVTDLTVDNIAKSFRECQLNILHAQQEIKNSDDVSVAQEKLGNAIIALFNLLFGREQTENILEFFEGNYTEMIMQIMPFINDVIKPAIDTAVKDSKAEIAEKLNLSRAQRRKMGV